MRRPHALAPLLVRPPRFTGAEDVVRGDDTAWRARPPPRVVAVQHPAVLPTAARFLASHNSSAPHLGHAAIPNQNAAARPTASSAVAAPDPQRCASPGASDRSAAREEAARTPPLAVALFELLQLRRHAEMLTVREGEGEGEHEDIASGSVATSTGITAPDTRARQPRQAKASPSSSCPLSAPEGSLQARAVAQLCREARALAAALQRAPGVEPREASLTAAATTSNNASRHAGRSGSQGSKAAAVPLVSIPSDAEETLLLPLQRDLVQLAMQRLSLLEATCMRLLLQQPGTPTPRREGDAQRAEPAASLFYREQLRVVAELVALRGQQESDGQALSCLVHLLGAPLSADAGVADPVVTLISASAAAVRRRQQRQHQRSGVETADAIAASMTASSAASSSSRDATTTRAGALATWCSCTPWLLHVYAATIAAPTRPLHARPARRSQASNAAGDAAAAAAAVAATAMPSRADRWSAASAWLTAAADRVCATPASELLVPLSRAPPSRAASRDSSDTVTAPFAGGVEASAARHTFGLWQRVLDAEAVEEGQVTGPTDMDNAGASDVKSVRRPPHAPLSPVLRDLCAAHGVTATARGSSLWQPYWALVVHTILASGARAAGELLRLQAAVQATEPAHRLPGSPIIATACAAAASLDSSHAMPRGLDGYPPHSAAGPRAPSRRTRLAELEALQYHAVGAYVSLRRIASSLHRHRRLAPLLHLHTVVSGRATTPADGAIGVATVGSADGVSCAVHRASAAHWRARLLRGALLEPLAARGVVARRREAAGRGRARSLQGRRRAPHRRGEEGPMQAEEEVAQELAESQLQQAGAMLWREVVLFDAYTLITVGHVSEHAVDGEGWGIAERAEVLRQLAWLQHECTRYLNVLTADVNSSSGSPPSRGGTSAGDAADAPAASTAPASASDATTSCVLSPARRRALLRRLTPRTHAALVAKLQEGLRLSAKVLARWGTPAQICDLYLRYPTMGASWEVGRALLRCGQYRVAVEVLQTLLQLRPHSTAPPPSVSSSASAATHAQAPHAGTTPITNAAAAATVRQMLLEAMEGAAAALVCRDPPLAQRGSPPTAAAHAGLDGGAGAVAAKAGRPTEDEVPLPAELRAQLRQLYASLQALPVPLPLCLHAVMVGLTNAMPAATAPASDPAAAAAAATATSAATADEQARTTAVLCTYVLRCHLRDHPHAGLLAKTVELWASAVAPYLGRRVQLPRHTHPTPTPSSLDDHGPTSALAVAPLTSTDHYLRSVAAHLVYGYPHLPVARLLLTRLVQRISDLPDSSVRYPEGFPHAAQGRVDAAAAFVSVADARVAGSVVWLLGVLYGMPRLGQTEMSSAAADAARCDSPASPTEAAGCGWGTTWAHRLCVSAVAAAAVTATVTSVNEAHRTRVVGGVKGGTTARSVVSAQDGVNSTDTPAELWNAGFTERHVFDALRIMPRIALEILERLLDALQRHYAYRSAPGAPDASTAVSAPLLEAARTRVSAMRASRVADEEAQRHPWQCTTCLLWNSRYAVSCRRCQALSTVLLQCRACGCLTSSAALSDGHSLGCDVCGSVLVAASPSAGAAAVPCSAPCASVAGAVTGTGRPATLFTESAAVAGVVALRPWSCTQCRTLNEAQHAFFCRGCGHAAPSIPSSASPAGEGEEACDTCGHRHGAAEARRVPWCERCGALRTRIQQLLQTRKAQEGRGTAHSATAATLPSWRQAHLWWCPECAGALNPWTRTHCDVCNAGRPAAATSRSAHREPHAADDSNVAVPLVTLPWSMQSCDACRAANRVGLTHCWQCRAPLTWPASVRRAVQDGWWRWATQVMHVVTVTTPRDAPHPTRRRTEAPLAVPRLVHWLCLHKGCLQRNEVPAGAACGGEEVDGVAPAHDDTGTALCCSACTHVPRGASPLLLNPFADRFAWRCGSTLADARGVAAGFSAAASAPSLVEAVLLPASAPWPGDVTVVQPPSAAAGPPVTPQLWNCTPSAEHRRGATCVRCGACALADSSAPAAPSSSSLLLLLLQLQSPPYLVHVCAACGWCTWGRSACAYSPPPSVCCGVAAFPSAQVDASGEAPPSVPLLPGEHAMALRVLLRTLGRVLRAAAATTEVSVGAARRGPADTRVAAGGPATAASRHPRQLDWAWLSRFVLSAVRLLGAASEPRRQRRWCAVAQERLPWRGCDLTSPRQACSSEPRVAVLGGGAGGNDDDAEEGAVHAALLDVRAIVDDVCTLVEHRLEAQPHQRAERKASPTTRSFSSSSSASTCSTAVTPPLSLQDAWTRRLLVAALDLIDLVNVSTVCDEIGFSTLRRLCVLLRPHDEAHIATETKWVYLRRMKLPRTHIVHGCARCEWCLTDHDPQVPCPAV